MISNEFKIMNQNDVRQLTYEGLLWGNPSVRFVFIFSAYVLIISVLDFFDSDTDMLSTLLYMTVFVIMNIVVIITFMYTSNKVAKRYNGKEKNLCLTIENSDVTYKVMEGDKEIQSTTYSVNDVKGLYRVKNYSFLIMNDKSVLYIKNDSFTNGSLDELKKKINDIKREKKEIKKKIKKKSLL